VTRHERAGQDSPAGAEPALGRYQEVRC
jgi:hypothetical protein